MPVQINYLFYILTNTNLNRLGFGMFTMETAIFHWLLIAVLYSVNNNKNNHNNILLIKLFGFGIDVGKE